MIKDVLVNLTVGAARDVTAEYAISVASAFQAQLCAIRFVYEGFVPGSVFDSIPAELMDTPRTENGQAAQAAASSFEEAARRAGLSAEARLVHSSLGAAAGTFAGLARSFDISIVAQAEPDKGGARDQIIEAALFESGRPVLVVPYIQREGIKLDHVMVCWDGGCNAARAIADAMPFLARANAVEVVMVVGEAGKRGEIPAADMAHHLARHGLNVELKRIVTGDLDATNRILSHAADAKGDFIVMGGYGHSRWRELVLGGATRGILKSMTVPTLMSH